MEMVREITDGIQFKHAQDAANYLDEFRTQDREFIIVIGLDTKNKPIYREISTIGLLDSSQIHAREVFKKAIVMSCKSIILAHNHPSGDSTPSQEDKNVTEHLVKCGELLGIKVLDHIIITETETISII